MRKMLLCVVAIAIVGFIGWLPFAGTDVGKLHPVEVLTVSISGEQITIETDTGIRVTGDSLSAAIEDLKLASAGKIFLDTANYLLVNDEGIGLLPELFALLRPACQVYIFAGSGKWERVAKYLESHPSDVTLLGYMQGMKDIPKLSIQGEEYKIDRS